MSAGPPPGPLAERERELLLHLIAPTPRQPAPRADCDWAALLDFGSMVLSPLMLAGIRAGRAGPDVPPAVIARLESQARSLAVAYLQRQAALRAAAGALAGDGIPALVLKGAALAHLVYPDPVLRPMTDLDIWVPHERLDEAVRSLAAHGVRYPPALAARTAATNPPARARTRKLEHQGTGIAIELHGRFTSFLGLPFADFDAAWARSEAVSLGGVAARVLGRDQLLTHLGLHLARAHAFQRSLVNLVDLALVITRWRDAWPWERLAGDWRRARVTAWMLLSLTLARDLLGAPVPPPETLAAPLPDSWPVMRRIAEDRLWEARRFHLPPAAGGLARRGTVADRVRFLRRRLFDYYWRAPGTPGLLPVLRDGFRRLWYDVSVKLPRYVRGVRGGSLRGTSLARGIALEHSRLELERLVMAGGDVGYVAPPAEPAPERRGPTIASGPAAG